VTKGLVLVQATCFLLQCAARGAQHLSLTKFEFATAAFALLNVITYVLWWDKPLDVQCPVMVRKRHVSSRGVGEEVASRGKGADRVEDYRHAGDPAVKVGYLTLSQSGRLANLTVFLLEDFVRKLKQHLLP
jgi:hypothetical protein